MGQGLVVGLCIIACRLCVSLVHLWFHVNLERSTGVVHTCSECVFSLFSEMFKVTRIINCYTRTAFLGQVFSRPFVLIYVRSITD